MAALRNLSSVIIDGAEYGENQIYHTVRIERCGCCDFPRIILLHLPSHLLPSLSFNQAPQLEISVSRRLISMVEPQMFLSGLWGITDPLLVAPALADASDSDIVDVLMARAYASAGFFLPFPSPCASSSCAFSCAFSLAGALVCESLRDGPPVAGDCHRLAQPLRHACW